MPSPTTQPTTAATVQITSTETSGMPPLLIIGGLGLVAAVVAVACGVWLGTGGPSHDPLTLGQPSDSPGRGRAYRSGRACLPISITSSKPSVVISAVRAPFRSSNAFVATVVPCTISKGSEAAASRIRAIPPRIASAGLCGVDGALKEVSREPRAATKSVNVLRLCSFLPCSYQSRPISPPPRTCAMANPAPRSSRESRGLEK